MKQNISNLLEEYQGKLSGYVAMLSYQLVNLCIKADPVTLLGVTIPVEGSNRNIEDVALIGAGDDKFSIHVYPKDASHLMLVGKGIADEHPEFKQELRSLTLKNGTELRYLKLTMPEVNENRKKVIETELSTLHDACTAALNFNKTLYAGRLSLLTVGLKDDEIDQAKQQFDQTTDQHSKACQDVTDAKQKEIDDAYAAFTEAEQQRQQQQSDKNDAEGLDKITSLPL